MIMKNLSLCMTVILMAAGLVGCSNEEKNTTKETKEITVAAAASLKNSLLQVENEFESQHKQSHITFYFGSTGALRKQIEQGAPIDVFLSASKQDYDALHQERLVESGDKLVGNRVVAVTNKPDKIHSLEDAWNNDEKIVIGNPSIAPVGNYAKKILQKSGQWSKVEPKIIYGKDASNIIMLMNQGVASVGLVYSSDAQANPQLTVIDSFNHLAQKDVGYYGALIKRSKQPEISMEFLHFLKSKEAKKIFKENGFTDIQVNKK